ncbi:hypothetical protein DL764_002045 [Monosporascus ibericus]|uniref:Uncharacterized protein n=1 Tax=Monosporascus ibericus TaxID=155417 RepID=A0A4Q4TRK6_9PEZI|nr:hypothetical protein DL764_002045 [Monosporascus ibericus]
MQRPTGQRRAVLAHSLGRMDPEHLHEDADIVRNGEQVPAVLVYKQMKKVVETGPGDAAEGRGDARLSFLAIVTAARSDFRRIATLDSLLPEDTSLRRQRHDSLLDNGKQYAEKGNRVLPYGAGISSEAAADSFCDGSGNLRSASTTSAGNYPPRGSRTAGRTEINPLWN